MGVMMRVIDTTGYILIYTDLMELWLYKCFKNQIFEIKMEFNILFVVVASLSFTIEYNINSNTKQDFFIFRGEEATAHLFRENTTINLYLLSNSSFELFQSSTFGKNFNFTWDGFRIDGKQMEMAKSNGQIGELNFNGYTFLSPHLGAMLDPVEDPQLETIYQNSETNYGLIVLIVLSIGMVLKTDIIAKKVWKKIVTDTPETLSTDDEDSYIERV